MKNDETFIREITNPDEFTTVAKVIRNSFKTVAEEFGLTRASAPTHPVFLTVRWLKKKKSDDVKFFGLFLGSRQIGFIIIEKENADTCWIEKLAVLPAYRHGGSGAKLIGFAIDFIREHGGKKVALGMMNEHTVLKNWYKKLGFKQIATRKYPQLPFTVCYMERDTAPLVIR